MIISNALTGINFSHPIYNKIIAVKDSPVSHSTPAISTPEVSLKKLFEAVNKEYGYITRSFLDLNGNLDFTKTFFDINGKIDVTKKAAFTAQIQQIIDQGRPAVALLVLHQVSMNIGYLKDSPAKMITGDAATYFSTDVRAIRTNIPALREAGIFPEPVESRPLVTHNDQTCFFCSASKINAKELVLDLTVEGRPFEVGFTFAPIGNPATALHFLSWDKVHVEDNNQKQDIPAPSMDLSDHTIKDLAKHTELINKDLTAYCREKSVNPVTVDGLFNGWAGNSIYHNHYQFNNFGDNPFVPKTNPGNIKESVPVAFAKPVTTWQKTGVEVSRLDWPTAVYRIKGETLEKAVAAANDIAQHWKDQDEEGIAKLYNSHLNHTQNIYMPGNEEGKVIYLFLRYSDRVKPEDPLVNPLAVFEATGHMNVDNPLLLDKIKEPGNSGLLVDWLGAINPQEGLPKLEEFLTMKFDEAPLTPK